MIGHSKWDLDTPALLLDLAAMDRNIERMAATFREAGVGWRPHTKAIKIPAIAHKLLRAGALGVTCAKVSEAEVMVAGGIRDILIITTPHDQPAFRNLLGDGAQWGIHLSYAVQPSPDGLAQAFIIGREFVGSGASALVLGDNIFYGHDLVKLLHNASLRTSGASVFAYRVHDPERYGVV